LYTWNHVSSSSSSSSPLCRTLALICLKQIMSLWNVVLQLFCSCCPWCMWC
jgi:hypothetical protein